MFVLILFLLDVIVKNQIGVVENDQVNKSKTLTNGRHIGVVRKFV